MAYQPKSYRKFVAGTVTAAVVASAVAPVASAAESFSDVPANHQFAEAINALAEQGTFVGKDGKFDIYGELTRRQAAVVFARLIEGEGKMEQVFSDVDTADAELTKAAYEVNAAGVMTGANGKLNPYAKLTRQQMAKIIVEHFDLKHVEGAEVEIKDLDQAHESQREYIQILAENGITVVADGNFRPTETVKRGQFAAFVYRAQQGGNVEELAISGAEVLSADGRYLEVQFNAPVGSVDKSQFEVREAGSSKRVGIESVKASGKNVELVAYDAEEADEIKEGKKYTVSYTANGKTLSYTFERPYYIDDVEDDARVIEVDAENKDFTVSTMENGKVVNVTIDVPKDVNFDYEEALGMEARVWYTGDKKLMKFELASTDVYYDAFEVTEAPAKDKGEIELQVAGKELDLATDKDGDVTAEFYLNGKEMNITDLKKDAEYPYAKVILDDKGDVAYIYAYQVDDFIVVDKMDGEVVEGLGDDELDLEDFVIVKDGKTIKASDIKAGDTVYFNETIDNSIGEEGYAVVYNNVITGEIEDIYDSSFVIKGEKYNYSTIKYVDEDGDIVDSFDKDDAEDFEGNEVTVYVDRFGDVRLLTGAITEGNSNLVDVLLTEKPLGYTTTKGKLAVEVEFVDVTGKESTKDVYFDDLDKVTINGVKYNIDQDSSSKDYSLRFKANSNNETVEIVKNNGGSVVETLNLDDNLPVKIGMDDDKVVTSVEAITAAQVKTNSDTIEAGDSYAKTSAGNKRLSDNTLVYVAKEGAKTDAEDIKIYKFKDISFDVETGKGTVFYNEDGDVEYIIVSDTVGTDTTDYTAVMTDVQTNDGDVVRLTAWVEGKKQTYTVDEVEVSAEQLTALKKDGTLVQIQVNDDNGIVEEIFFPGNADEFPKGDTLAVSEVLEGQNVKTVSSGSKEFTLSGKFASTTFKLTSDAVVIDAEDTSDITVGTLRDIEDKVVDVVLDSKGSRYVKAIVIRDSKVADTTAPNQVTNLTFTDNDVDANQVGGEITFTASTSTDVATTVVTFNGNVVPLVNGKYTVAQDTAIGNGKVVVTLTDNHDNTSTTEITVTDVVTP
jgi:hypothetical protein